MKKKVLAMLLTGAMAFSMLTGCGKGSGGGGKEQDLSSADLKGEPNEWGWVVPEETLVLDVYAGMGDQQELEADEKGGKAVMDKWLLDNMNVQINFQYSNMEMDQQLQLWLTSGDYPAIITNMTDDMAEKFIAQGKALDLTEALEKYGDNITRRYGKYMNMMKSSDGKVYKLATLYGDNVNVAGSDFGIRYDYWKELGEDKIYETPEEYYEVLKKVLANHPTDDNGNKTYGLSATDKKGQNLLNGMLGAYGFIGGYKYDEASGEMTHWLNTDEGLEIAKFMNKLYREEIIDPSFLSTDYEKLMTDIHNGTIIGNCDAWWYGWTGGHQYWATQDAENWDLEKRIANVSVHAEGLSMEDTTLLTSRFLGSYRCIVTDKCKDLGMVMRYLNWENSELGNFVIGWGAPSADNVWDIAKEDTKVGNWVDGEWVEDCVDIKAGTWLMKDVILDVDRKEEIGSYHDLKEKNGAGIYSIALNGNWLYTNELQNFDLIDPRVSHVSIYDYWPVNPDTGEFSNEGVKLSWGFYTAPMQDTSLFAVTWDATQDITTKNENVKSKLEEAWANMVTAESEEACESIFYEYRETCNQLGLEEITEYVKSQHDTNAEKYNG